MNRKYAVILLIAVCFVLGGIAYAQQAKDDITAQKSCIQCGMDRDKYNFSRMAIDYEDGTNAALCSLRCAADNLAINKDKTPKSIKVADLNGRHLIDAEKAFWVVGGSKRGVMTRQGKWAFENKNDAENFMKTNLGKMVPFQEALDLAFDEMPYVKKETREKIKTKLGKIPEYKN